jgi:UDP-N-acetylmuramoylalanine--D-glutamate ligase
MYIKGKKISIIGAVRSGIAAAKLAKKLGAIPFVSDSGSKEKFENSIQVFESIGIDYEFGGHTEKIFNCDFIITSPGVPSDSPILLQAAERNIKVISELEFAAIFCDGIVISITGTNGKTTTTALISHIINECGKKCYVAGNIGNAFSEITLDVKHGEFVALETSSFQLDFIDRFKPQFSIILNITPDHLDRYNNNFNEYIISKIKVAKNQVEEDFIIFNADDSNIKPNLKNKRVQKLSFSLINEIPAGAYYKNNKIFFAWFGEVTEICSNRDLFIKGEHNIANALAAISVVKTLQFPNRKIRNAISSFKGVEHRIEFVREIDGVEYFNDSKATNVDSVSVALKSFEKPIYLILGGKDKGNNYDQIKELIEKRVKKIYAIGSSAGKVYDYFKLIVPTEIKNSMEDCVESAHRDAVNGSVVLLSPACASFDMFDNYEHRGKVFKELVNKLI